jgi:hypothetical protein
VSGKHGDIVVFWRGCRCADCREANRVYAIANRRRLGIRPRRVRPPQERFWEKVVKTDTCWLWTASTGPDGYGLFRVGRGKTMSAHRFAFTSANGVIPQGMQIDHLCTVRPCVNPDHLELVTLAENMRRVRERREFCKRGHEFTEENTYWMRTCRRCTVERSRRNRRKAAA